MNTLKMCVERITCTSQSICIIFNTVGTYIVCIIEKRQTFWKPNTTFFLSVFSFSWSIFFFYQESRDLVENVFRIVRQTRKNASWATRVPWWRNLGFPTNILRVSVQSTWVHNFEFDLCANCLVEQYKFRQSRDWNGAWSAQHCG